MRVRSVGMLIAVAASCWGTPGRADLLLEGGGTAEYLGYAPYQTSGFSFTVGPMPVDVIRLGVLDQQIGAPPGSGLFESHEVGLWDEAGTLLASVVVPGGTAAPLVNGFRFAGLAEPVTLLAGHKYVLGAYYATPWSVDPGADVFRVVSPANMSSILSSSFQYGEGRFSDGPGPGLAFPVAVPGLFDAAIGPNLEVVQDIGSAVQPVPEPGTAAMALMAGIVAFGWAGRRGRPERMRERPARDVG